MNGRRRSRITAISAVATCAVVVATLAVAGCGSSHRATRTAATNATTATGTSTSDARWTELTWKCEDEDSFGRAIGPAIVYDGHTARDYDDDWHTRAEARAIARRLHVRFTVDC